MRDPSAFGLKPAKANQPKLTMESQARMRHPSAFTAVEENVPAIRINPEIKAAGDTVIFADQARDMYCCVQCYDKMSPKGREVCLSGFRPISSCEQRGFQTADAYCDFCSMFQGATKLTVARSMVAGKQSATVVAKACASFSYTGTPADFIAGLIEAGYTTADACLIQAEVWAGNTSDRTEPCKSGVAAGPLGSIM
jgi:hypothetical protein